ncbi:SlyX family protein [Rubripirellula reticaptiva]|uniref:Protein SlyX n=1 Tax=Rubripirellula reticaptiva TaxID=2528013 RepID=A0A5C6EL93_9BACT|nr:SlyX family protein [Rubripirellula reticaptiva]TWU48376.1 hypothetical protein Poly59_52230 [Rubripirellula reticaptiva]
MASDKTNADRLTELEIQLAHVQRMYEHLNEVVTTEAMRGDRIQRKVDALTVQLKEVKSKSAEPATDPLDEKPPHY